MMWSRPLNFNYRFPSLNLKVNVSELAPELNWTGGVKITIEKDENITTLGIRCIADYRGKIEGMEASAKSFFQAQAEQINMLNELLEKIENEGSLDERFTLNTMQTAIHSTCLKALLGKVEGIVTCDNPVIANLDAFQFIGAGKRMNVETYELHDSKYMNLLFTWFRNNTI